VIQVLYSLSTQLYCFESFDAQVFLEYQTISHFNIFQCARTFIRDSDNPVLKGLLGNHVISDSKKNQSVNSKTAHR
jgi:hypothetical protein